MNHLPITVIDRTAGKLLLFLPALDALVTLNTPIAIESEQKDVVAQMKRLSPNIVDAVQNAPDNVRIVLVDSNTKPFEQRQEKTIVFPIVSRANDWEIWKGKSDFFVPLSEQSFFGKRLGDAASLIDFVRYFQSQHPLQGKCILITAGPTAEDLDPVRYLTNRSSGKMGLALARAAFISGANVKLIMGPGSAIVPAYLSVQRVRSAAEMAERVLENFDGCDAYIGAAAVADFTPAQRATEKIKKKEGVLHLPLKRTVDILKTLSERRSKQILVGFSVETENVIENSLQKLRRKHLDLIVANNPKEQGAAFGTDTNKVTVIEKNGHVHNWPLMSKRELSLKIMELLAKVLNK